VLPCRMPLIAAASGRRVRQMRKRSMFFWKHPIYATLTPLAIKEGCRAATPEWPASAYTLINIQN